MFHNLPPVFSSQKNMVSGSSKAKSARTYYKKHGQFKGNDLIRILGDIRGVRVGPNSQPSWIEPPQDTE